MKAAILIGKKTIHLIDNISAIDCYHVVASLNLLSRTPKCHFNCFQDPYLNSILILCEH